MGLSPTRPLRTRGGFSLLEVYVALSVLSMMLVGLLQARETLALVRAEGDEHAAAMGALLGQAGRLQELSANALLAPGPWAQQLLERVEREFDVEGLEPPPHRPTVGRLRVPTDERTIHPELGLPCDMDGSGAVDSPDVSRTAERLPIVIEIAWIGRLGRQDLTRSFWLER